MKLLIELYKIQLIDQTELQNITKQLTTCKVQ